MQSTIRDIAFAGLAGCAVLIGCTGDSGEDLARDTTAVPAADTASITADMKDALGRELGTLTLTESPAGIVLAGQLSGLPPGERGFHIHGAGLCEPPAFESSGDHWNPTGSAHGTGDPDGPHFGDLPNLVVADDSSVMVQTTTPGGTLHGANALLDQDGAAVIVHAAADDYRTQPSGDSGDRIACGVVER